MLDPRDRLLLFEALRPPPGFSFDRAVGTTFSLDPTALLAVPLAFAAFDVETEQRAPHDDSLALLEAVRRNARHVSLFCQAGRISVPARYRSLLTYLEGSVVEVTAPKDGYVFHPKVWLVRYAGTGDEVAYRFLCLSRNLTFDRSWDTVLTLDGTLTDRTNAFSVNHPLGDFVAALPGLAVREVPADTQRDVDLLQDEVRRVRFEPPDGFESASFLPMGLTGRQMWPFPQTSTRGLVISPFLSTGFLEDVPEARHGVTLVSRLESLEELDAEAFSRMKDCYFLSEAAEPEPVDAEPVDQSGAQVEASGLSGLHAKLFVFDDRGQTTLWTGSANATTAAFDGNVEFLVELQGPRWFCGAERTLGSDEDGLKTLLEPYVPGEASPGDPVQRRLDFLLDTCRTLVASLPLRLHVEPSASGDNTWRMTMKHSGATLAKPLPLNVTAHAWPITHAGRRSPCDLSAEVVAEFGELSLEAVTPFVAFSMTAELETGQKAEAVFVVNLPLDGEPAGRDSLVLREFLRRPGDLIALLLLLLADDEFGFMDAMTSSGDSEPAGPWHGFGSPGLFETLVKTLAREPNKLRTVKRLVNDLRKAEADISAEAVARALDAPDAQPVAAVALIPEGFDEIWEPVWASARALGVPDVEAAGDD
jgi:hypothetical protein